MNQRSLGALIALNIALLAALIVVSLPGQAVGQAKAARGDYMMLSGDVSGKSDAVIYVIETRSSKVLAFFYSSATNKIEIIDGRTLNDDITAISTGR